MGPRGCVLFLAGIDWFFEGLGVFNHLDGTILDAPHIHYMPNSLRAMLWITTGLVCIVLAFRREYGHIGAALLWLMPLVRVVSYLTAWVASWTWVDPIIPDADLPGDPRGWYYVVVSMRGLLIALFATWAPIAWNRSDWVYSVLKTGKKSEDEDEDGSAR